MGSLVPGDILTDFQAEAKRSWFSLRDSLRGAKSKAILWLPANVSLHGSTVAITTGEDAKEFRAHRVAWQTSRQFSVSGLDQSGRLSRVVLRFETVDNASTAATALVETGLVVEEPLRPSAVEIAAEMTLQIPLVSIFWIVLIVLLAIAIFPRSLDPDAFVGWGLAVLTLFALRLIFFLPLVIRRDAAWIRKEGDLVLLRTMDGSIPIANVKVDWKDSKTFSLKTGKRRVKLSFKTPEDALAAIRLLEGGSEVETRERIQ